MDILVVHVRVSNVSATAVYIKKNNNIYAIWQYFYNIWVKLSPSQPSAQICACSSTIIFNIEIFMARGKKDYYCLHETTVNSCYFLLIVFVIIFVIFYNICYNMCIFFIIFVLISYNICANLLKYIFIHSFIHSK